MDLLKSPRFIGVLIIGVLQALVLFNIISGEQLEGLVLIIQSVIGAAIAVRTVDRVGDRQVLAAAITSNQVAASSVVDLPERE